MMKKFLLATVGLVALGMAAPASAADLAARPYTKAPPPMIAPIYDWTGFYIGANAGYAWSNRCLDITAINGVGFVEAEGCRNAGGGVAGGQIGYRWQTNNFVFGVEAMGDWANLRNSNAGRYLDLQNQCIGSFHGSGRLCLEQRSLVRKGRRCSRQPAVGSF